MRLLIISVVALICFLRRERRMKLSKIPPPKQALDGRQPQNFSEWLEVATFDLVPSAQARVRPEIESHYTEAVQTYLALGKSEADAHAAALADLGEAKAAARRFMQKHLTTQDAKSLAEQLQSARGPVSSKKWNDPLFFLGFSIFFIFCWVTIPSVSANFLFCALALLATGLVSVGLNIAAGHLARRKTTLALANRVHLLGKLSRFSSQLGHVPYCLVFYIAWNDDVGLAFKDLPGVRLVTYLALALGSVGIALLLDSLRRSHAILRKKLAHATEDDLLPPSDPTTA